MSQGGAQQIEKNSSADNASVRSNTGIIDAVLGCILGRTRTEPRSNPPSLQTRISVDSGIGSEEVVSTQPGGSNSQGTAEPQPAEVIAEVPAAAPVSNATTSASANGSVPEQAPESSSTAPAASTYPDRPPPVPSPIPHRVLNARVLDTVTHPRPYPPPGTESIILEEGAPPLGHALSALHTPTPPSTSGGQKK